MSAFGPASGASGDDAATRPHLRFQRPSLPELHEVERYLARSREARWFSNGGPCMELLRERLSERVGAYCVPVASGTAGLLAALAALLGEQRRPAGTALLPSFTFAATAQAATWTGCAPRLLDVDPDSWHLDPRQLEHELHAAGRTAAVALAVSSFGTPPPPHVRERWEAACRGAGVPLVVDSAAAFGAVAEDGLPIGRQGDVEVVSFHATKPFAIGEGGAVFTRDRRLFARVEEIVNFGMAGDRKVRAAFGFNGKLSELHAATALAVLDGYDDVLSTRRRTAAHVHGLAPADVAFQQGHERSTWQFVPVALRDGQQRSALQERSAGRVETRVYYEPLHGMPAFRAAPRAEHGLATTEALASRLLCLPMANDLTDAETQLIADVLRGDRAGREAGAVSAAHAPR